MSKVLNIREEFNNIVNESEEIRSILCADIVFSSKYIKKSVFPPSKKFKDEITKIFNILNQYYNYNSSKGKINHPYLKNRDAYDELVELSKRSDPQALGIILSKIPKYRNILTLFELYSILRIVNEFSIEYAQYIRTPYFEERLKLCEK